MSLIDVPSQIIVFLLCIIALESLILFVVWINSRTRLWEIIPPNNQETSRFYGFTFRHYTQLGLAVIFLLIVLVMVIFAVVPLYIAVSDFMNSAGVQPALPYISIALAFIAISVTLFFHGMADITKVFDVVAIRNRDNAIHNRLDDLETALQRIENR